VFDDGVDAATAGAFAELGAEVVEGWGIAGGDEFDFAGVGVADPAAEAELGGFAVDEPTKTDALHATADEKVKDHLDDSVSQSRLWDAMGGRINTTV
jgi:hypothetical protein